ELDGRSLGRFDAFPRPDRSARLKLRRGFPGLHRITGVLAEGGIFPAPLPDSHPEIAPQWLTGGRALWISRRLELISPAPRPPVALPGGGGLELLPLAGGGFGAALPGRLWRGAAGAALARRCRGGSGRALRSLPPGRGCRFRAAIWR